LFTLLVSAVFILLCTSFRFPRFLLSSHRPKFINIQIRHAMVLISHNLFLLHSLPSLCTSFTFTSLVLHPFHSEFFHATVFFILFCAPLVIMARPITTKSRQSSLRPPDPAPERPTKKTPGQKAPETNPPACTGVTGRNGKLFSLAA
jgi:hypothetical protein